MSCFVSADEIDGAGLSVLNDTDMVEMGITVRGHRLKVRRAIADVFEDKVIAKPIEAGCITMPEINTPVIAKPELQSSTVVNKSNWLEVRNGPRVP